MKATKENLEKVLNGIKNERETLPEYSSFGDNNWKSLDASIKILESALSDDYSEHKYEREIDKYDTAYEINYWINNGDDKTDLIGDYT